MKADRIDLGLTGYDELFMSTEERIDAKKPKVDELPLDKLKPFKEHPFKVMEDEEMERLKESIRESGVYQIMACDELTPSLSQAQRLRKLSEDYTLTDSGISQIMSEIKGNQKEYLKIEVAPLRRYFPPGTTAKQMQTTMLRAMEFYRQHTQNRADKPKEREER